jgi:hypothetical protein
VVAVEGVKDDAVLKACRAQLLIGEEVVAEVEPLEKRTAWKVATYKPTWERLRSIAMPHCTALNTRWKWDRAERSPSSCSPSCTLSTPS